jgi:predicted TPR repeat methyltransferase
VPVDQGTETARLFTLALDHFRARRTHEAEQLCQAALALAPRHALSLHLLGVIAAQSGRPEAALELIRRAIDADSAAPEFHNSLGNAFTALGRRDEAAAAYRQAVALAPGYAPAHLNLGNALREAERLGEAAEEYRQAVALQPDNIAARMNLGAILARRGAFEEALVEFEAVLSRQPQLAEANIHIGHVLAELGRLDDAIARYQRAVELRPENASAYDSLGNALQQQGRIAEAVMQYRQAVKLLPDSPKARIDLGLALVEQGQIGEAVAQSEVAARLSDQPGFSTFMLGVLLARCDLRDAAREQFEAYLRAEPSDPRGARMCLAAMGFGTPPERASRELLTELYVRRAGWWDRGPGASQHNLWAGLVQGAFEKYAPTPERLQVLDAGCGSGVIGALIGRRVARMDGVDLSAGLIERARAAGFYRNLDQDDLVHFMATHPNAYDVVTSSAVLVHFGDLEPAFAAVAETLRDAGLFIFTLFDNEDDENAVAVGSMERGYAQTGCYVHGRAYVARAALAHRFSVESLERRIFDHYEGKPRPGLIAVLRRDSRQPDRAQAAT